MHPNRPVVRPVSRGYARGVASGDVVSGDARFVVDEPLSVMVEGAFLGRVYGQPCAGRVRLSGVRGFCGVKRLAIGVGRALGGQMCSEALERGGG